MMTDRGPDGLFYYPPPSRDDQKIAARVTGLARALTLPPPIMSAMAALYGAGGYPLTPETRETWHYTTPLCEGSMTAMDARRVHVAVDIRRPELPRKMWPPLFRGTLAANSTYCMARTISGREAAEITGIPEFFVAAALRGAGARMDDRCNGIALGALLEDFCRKNRDSYRRADPLHALWDSRMTAVRWAQWTKEDD